jgi:deoxyhypusine synthase
MRELSGDQRARKADLTTDPVRAASIGAGTTIADLVDQMADMSIQARNIGQCAKVLERLLTDETRQTVCLGLAGPLIAAGLRNVIREMIATGMVDVVVSTGAIIYQDIYQARGFHHYQGTPAADDGELRDLYLDRIYDTYVDEEAFWATDLWCGRIADGLTRGPMSSRQYLNAVADQLEDDASILATCRTYGVPVFCPALNDSSIGIGLTEHRHRALLAGETPISIDSIQDNYELTQIVVQSPATSAIYVAGGVPKNYINDSVVMSYIFGKDRGHDYAIQCTTAVTADGGLSSSTLGEAQSWGKVKKDASIAMAWVEPSVALPLIAGYALQRECAQRRRRLEFEWDGEILQSLKPAAASPAT